jgi:hypothetical protein
MLGDVMSVSMTNVVLRVDGKDQKYDCNQVKKIMLVERQNVPPLSEKLSETHK